MNLKIISYWKTELEDRNGSEITLQPNQNKFAGHNCVIRRRVIRRYYKGERGLKAHKKFLKIEDSHNFKFVWNELYDLCNMTFLCFENETIEPSMSMTSDFYYWVNFEYARGR